MSSDSGGTNGCRCGVQINPRSNPKIVGGQDVKRKTDYPWQVKPDIVS